MTKLKSVSSKDVAREAGVSQATVSYVLNNVAGVKIKPETREAVLNAAKKLNYHPDLIARSMRLKKSMSIGIVTDKTISSFMFMNVLEGIKDALLKRNYTMTLCLNKSEDIQDSEYVRYFSSNRIDGIIFAYASLTDEEIAFLVDNGIPFVVIDTNARDEIIHLVKTDMTNAVIDAVRYLSQKGISRIGYLGPLAGDVKSRKYNAYLKGLEVCNIPFDSNIVRNISGSEEDIEKELEQFFSSIDSVPPAVICNRGNFTFHLLKYAAKKGIRIPKDMAVIAIGTSQFSTYSYPSLSAIEAPLYDIGYAGCNMLFDIMKDNIVKDVVVLEWKFVLRDSS